MWKYLAQWTVPTVVPYLAVLTVLRMQPWKYNKQNIPVCMHQQYSYLDY